MAKNKKDDFWSGLRPARIEDIEAALLPGPVPEDDAAVIRYVSILFWSMATRRLNELVIRRSEALPVPELPPDVQLGRVPSFQEAWDRLKVMSGLSEGRNRAAHKGVIKVNIRGQEFTVNVHFHDAKEDSFCELIMKEGAS